jgi:hypothetical protein
MTRREGGLKTKEAALKLAQLLAALE